MTMTGVQGYKTFASLAVAAYANNKANSPALKQEEKEAVKANKKDNYTEDKFVATEKAYSTTKRLSKIAKLNPVAAALAIFTASAESAGTVAFGGGDSAGTVASSSTGSSSGFSAAA